MKRILIGCEIIKKELQNLLQEEIKDMDVIWLDEDLHDHPEKLHEELQKKIDSLDNYDEIILSYGLCGNALIGLTATNCDILYPKIDDCINAMLYDNCALARFRKNSVFVSRGWLTTRNNFFTSYNKTVEKYGEPRARLIYKMMYDHYKNIIYMKTEDEIEEEHNAAAHDMAQKLGLDLSVEPASIRIYKKLLTCQDDGIEIKRLKKGQTIKFEDFIK